MMLVLLHESTEPHIHAGSSVLSLFEIAALTIAALAVYALLRAARRARVSHPARHEN